MTRSDVAALRSRVLDLLDKGYTVDEAVSAVGRNRRTYERWRSADREFALKADTILGNTANRTTGSDGFPDFPTFRKKYLHTETFWHQLQWHDMMEGREPRDLHPAMTYKPGTPNMVLINTPPNHAKSTTITVDRTIYEICRNPDESVIIISETSTLAKKFLYEIKFKLTSPMYEELIRDFAPEGGFAGKSAIWQADQVYLPSETRTRGAKDPTIQAIGIRSQVYGSRASRVILDDAITMRNAHQYRDQLEWLQREVFTRPGPGDPIWIVGTRVATPDLYSELMNPENYGGEESPWTYLAQPALLQANEDRKLWVTLWPRGDVPHNSERGRVSPDGDGLYPRWDGEHLYKLRASTTPETWDRAYQQLDTSSTSTFDAEKVRASINGKRRVGLMRRETAGHRPRGMDGLYVLAGMDPAVTGDTASLVYAVDPESEIRYVLDVAAVPDAPSEYHKTHLKEWAEKYRLREWVVERNAFQGHLVRDIELRKWFGTRGIRLHPHYTTGKNKPDPVFGVASMAALFDEGLIELPSRVGCEAVRMLESQLIAWRADVPTKHLKQDLVMALWFCELRAREIVRAEKAKKRGTFAQNRFLSKRDMAKRRVVPAELLRGEEVT